MNDKGLESLFYSLGLSGSGIGVWWIKREFGKYIYYHTESSATIYGMQLEDLPPREIYGGNWKTTAAEVYGKNKAYKNKIEASSAKMHKLLNGEVDYCEYQTPWRDKDGNEIWVTDKVYVADKSQDGVVLGIVGITINDTHRNARREQYAEIEQINKKIRSAEQRAVELAGFLVWSMNFEEFPEGDYLFCNDKYTEALGLERNENGYVKFEDFQRTKYDDEEGLASFNELLNEFSKSQQNQTDDFLGVIVKHKNLKTNEPVYLEHYSRVDERQEDGTVKRIGGYIVDITSQVILKRKNKELDSRNRDLQLAQKLAVDSGKVLIWYLNEDTTPKANYFFGNGILFDKLGLARHDEDYFLISEYNDTLYTDDEEGKLLCEAYLALDDKIDNNELDSYSKVIVKHRNPKTQEIFYFEHNFIVEERYENGTLKIRGGYMNDITTETLYKKRIEFLVKHDLVTGLNNRNMFEEYQTNSKFPKSYTLLVIDIDGLKFINDAFGHISGDNAIKILAKVLLNIFDEDSTIFRIGGDEFTIITNDTNQSSIDERIKEIKSAITQDEDENRFQFNVSVGYEIVIKNDIDFESAFTTAENIMYRRKLTDRNSRKSQTMATVLETLNTKTEETKAHCDRLGNFAVKVLKGLGYTRTSDLEDMRLLCQVHDVGKITISEELLSTSRKLTRDEFKKIQQHSEAGYKIVKNIVESDVIAYGVLYHHERFDGTGYPFGLKENEIPLYAKVLSICDSYDVMVEGRPYQRKKSHKAAIEEIKKYSGTQFDPKIVDIFINTFSN